MLVVVTPLLVRIMVDQLLNAAYTACFSAGDGIAISAAGLDAGSTESIASIAAWSTGETPTFALVFASPSFAVGDSGEMGSTNDWP